MTLRRIFAAALACMAVSAPALAGTLDLYNSPYVHPTGIVDGNGAQLGISGNPMHVTCDGGTCTGGGGAGGAATIADGADVAQGTTTDAACGTDNGSCDVIQLIKRTNQRLTTINTSLGSPFQAGGALGASSAVIGHVIVDTSPTTAITAAALPLPAGASTAAKQAAPGSAGTASTDVLTAQGIAGMTPFQVAGAAAAGAIPSGGPVYQGNVCIGSSVFSSKSAGQMVGNLGDCMGRAIVQLGGVPGLQVLGAATLSNTTETSCLAAIASVKQGLFNLNLYNPDTVAHTFLVRDSTAGTIRKRVVVAAADSKDLNFDQGIWQAAVNTAWTIQLNEAVTTNNPVVTCQAFQTTG